MSASRQLRALRFAAVLQFLHEAPPPEFTATGALRVLLVDGPTGEPALSEAA